MAIPTMNTFAAGQRWRAADVNSQVRDAVTFAFTAKSCRATSAAATSMPKPTTTVNLAAGLAKVGQRVLMVDLDPQGNATMGSGVDKRKLEYTVYDVLLESASVAEAKIHSAKCGYDVLGANRDLAGAEVELVEVDRPGSARTTARSGRRRAAP